MKINEFGRSILTKCRSDAKMFLNDVYKKGTRAKKYQANELQCGRSMVEMLGVLAIIGVLSVGSIAGYSKAMKKYRLNKHTESYNMLLSNALQISASINKAPPGTNKNDIFYNEFLYKAQLLPDGISYKKEGWNVVEYTKNNHLVDVLGNKMSFYSRTSYGYSFGLFTALANNDYSKDICQNIINIAKEHASDIIMVLREDITTSGFNSKDSKRIFSDCTQGTCFKDLTITDVAKSCDINSKNSKNYYYIYVLW